MYDAIINEFFEKQRASEKESVVGKLDQYRDAKQQESGDKDSRMKEHKRDEVQR